MKNPIFSAAMLYCLATSLPATTIFSDTFNYGGVPNPESDLTNNIVARQSGGAFSSTYTKQTAGTNGVFLNDNSGLNVLLLRTLNTAGASQSAADLNTNFAASLAGNKYSITLTNVNFQRNSADISDVWFALSVGDDAGGSITGPNSGLADFALLLRAQDSGSRLWQDNVNTAGFDLLGSGATFGFNNRFERVVMTIDETGGIGNATGQIEVTAPNGVFTSSVINFDFENSAHRYLELRAHQGSAGTDGSLMDLRFDSLSIDVVDPIPEPSVAMLGAFGGLLLLRRRK